MILNDLILFHISDYMRLNDLRLRWYDHLFIISLGLRLDDHILFRNDMILNDLGMERHGIEWSKAAWDWMIWDWMIWDCFITIRCADKMCFLATWMWIWAPWIGIEPLSTASFKTSPSGAASDSCSYTCSNRWVCHATPATHTHILDTHTHIH